MNLEAIEERVLRHLGGASNPLVRFDVLFSDIQTVAPSEGMSRTQFLEFLRAHEEIRVIEPPAIEDSVAAALKEEGFLGVPHVILESRRPSADHLAAMLLEQIDRMGEALAHALAEAREAGDTDRKEAIERALQRTSSLRKKIAGAETSEN